MIKLGLNNDKDSLLNYIDIGPKKYVYLKPGTYTLDNVGGSEYWTITVKSKPSEQEFFLLVNIHE